MDRKIIGQFYPRISRELLLALILGPMDTHLGALPDFSAGPVLLTIHVFYLLLILLPAARAMFRRSARNGPRPYGVRSTARNRSVSLTATVK